MIHVNIYSINMVALSIVIDFGTSSPLILKKIGKTKYDEKGKKITAITIYRTNVLERTTDLTFDVHAGMSG